MAAISTSQGIESTRPGTTTAPRANVLAGRPPTQSTNLFTPGPAAKFLKQAPFSV